MGLYNINTCQVNHTQYRCVVILIYIILWCQNCISGAACFTRECRFIFTKVASYCAIRKIFNAPIKPWFLTLVYLFVPFTMASETVIVNAPLSKDDHRYDYPHKLLSEIFLATEDTYGQAKVTRSTTSMKRKRALLELEKGASLHVMAEAPKPEWEERLITVRIPIRKGLQGYRTFLILKKNQPMLSKIETLEELKILPTGSGEQWSTTRVLKSNGFNLVLGSNYEGLFGMLARERFVTFGRGINETTVEYEDHKDMLPELAIEKDLLLYIPLPTYFFVTPTKPNLAERIETGLKAMIADGSFEKIFEEEFGELIRSANLKNRRIFRINNPNLNSKTPLKNLDYWYQP